MRRALGFAAPALLAIGVTVAPWLAGSRTLLLRDVLNTHLGLRAYLGEAVRAGELPLIDPLRAGGQPLLGNPNTLALYPDNLLLLVGSTLWQENAHFALHWLVAFAAAFWLGRAWGLGREGAAGVGAAYALSGYFYSQLNLFNAVAGAALAPALVAALLELGEPRTRRRAAIALGALWALALLAGDPILAALALGFGAALALARHRRVLPLGHLALALALGTLVAAPQWVETARLLPESMRGFWGYQDIGADARDPRTLLDLLIPVFFGRPDSGGVWGGELFGGHPPLYFSLFPGLVALALALAAGRPRGRDRWALAALAALGLALAYSRGTWLATLFDRVPGGALFRFPEKLLLLPALAVALAAGAGLERMARGAGVRPFARAAGLLALPLMALWLGFGTGGAAVERWTLAAFAPALDGTTYGEERLRWAGLAMLALATLFVALAAAALLRRRPVWAVVALLAAHSLSQAFFMAPLVPTDDASFYAGQPALAPHVPREALLVHGGVNNLFGTSYDTHVPPIAMEPRVAAFERMAFDELYGFAGVLQGRRYEFNFAPEGLDHFVVQAVGEGMKQFTDPKRVEILRATGAELLLLHRALSPADAGGARLRAEVPGHGRSMFVYELPGRLPDLLLAGDVRFAPSVNDALETIWADGFDPAETAVVAGRGATRRGPAGSVRRIADERERVEVEVDSAQGGFLVLRRAFLPIWRAEVDGRPARPVIANLTRLAVEVPPGRHVVRLWVSRAPLRFALVGSLFGIVGLLALARAGGVRRARR
jgi:hypothetical protein